MQMESGQKQQDTAKNHIGPALATYVSALTLCAADSDTDPSRLRIAALH